MKAGFLRSIARSMPRPVRRLLGLAWDYSRRIGRWYLILTSVRGVTGRDKATLAVSAMASPVVGLRGLGRWQDPILLWDTEVLVKGVGRFRVRRHTDDLWHVLPDRERAVVDVIRSQLKPGDIFVDAGANIGFFTVLAGVVVGNSGRVLAVEMMPDTASVLRQHVTGNGLVNVHVFEAALSDAPGQTVTANIPVGKHGQASIASSRRDGGIDVRVSTTTLAEVLSGVGEVALMKMDLEGAEELAIRGAGPSLDRVRAIVFEDWGGNRLSELLQSRGFHVKRIDGNNSLATNQYNGRASAGS